MGAPVVAVSAPAALDAATRRRMRAQRTAGTKPEMEVRRRLHALGHRYRVDCRLLDDRRWRGDLVWKGRRLAVFVDGCFWHGCPEHSREVVHNGAWWANKIGRNRERDEQVTDTLRRRGWMVLRFWEHEDPDAVVEAIAAALRA